MRYLSPLRYPGGKARLAPYITKLINAQTPQPRHYAEPYAGGAGAALQLLHTEVVEHIHLNDLNPGIASLWRAILNQSGEFCSLIKTCPLTIPEWQRQREIYNHGTEHSTLELGFATFYLNRTNRSGILDARPIGGLEQNGKWKIDARFNRNSLIQRIETIAKLADKITITELDGIEFLASINYLGENVFIYADPPYLVQGERLYLTTFNANDHVSLAAQLETSPSPWMLTYDHDPHITDILYATARTATFQISHTAHKQHIGKESIIYSHGLAIPSMEVTKGRQAVWA